MWGTRRYNLTAAAAVLLAALISSLALGASAGATTFAYSNGFGATGIASTLDRPVLDAYDPFRSYVYVTEADTSADSYAVERFNQNGSPANFTAGDVNGNVLGLTSSDGQRAVFRGSPSSVTCSSQTNADIDCFQSPTGVTTDPAGNIYVGDAKDDTIEVFSSAGSFVDQVGPFFDGGGNSTTTPTGTYMEPEGLAYDSTDNLLFAVDLQGYVRVFSVAGTTIPTVTLIKTLGSGDGGSPAQFESPDGITTNSSGNFWVADAGNDRVDHWTYTYSGGTVSATPAADSPWAVVATGSHPQGITYTPGDGGQTPASVFVTDPGTEQVSQFSPTGSKLAAFGGYGPGLGQFENIAGIVSLANDGTRGTNLYILDAGEDQVEDWIPVPPPVNTAPPAITGTAAVGQTLAASIGGWTNTTATSTYTYDWQVCNSTGSCGQVQDGASNTFALTGADTGLTVKVGVIANNGQASPEVFSSAVGPVSSGTSTGTTTGTTTTTTPTTITAPGKTNTGVTVPAGDTTTNTVLSVGGQPITVKSPAGATIVVQLILDKKTAKLVKLGNGKTAVIVGQKTIHNAKRTATVKVSLTARARRALSKLKHSFKLTLRTTFSLDGRHYTVNRVETITRSKPKTKTKK